MMEAHADLFKHLSTFGSAGVVAVLVLYRELGLSISLTSGVLVCLGISVLLALYGLQHALTGLIPQSPGFQRASRWLVFLKPFPWG
jgi:hypothetical protein